MLHTKVLINSNVMWNNARGDGNLFGWTITSSEFFFSFVFYSVLAGVAFRVGMQRLIYSTIGLDYRDNAT